MMGIIFYVIYDLNTLLGFQDTGFVTMLNDEFLDVNLFSKAKIKVTNAYFRLCDRKQPYSFGRYIQREKQSTFDKEIDHDNERNVLEY